MSTQSPALRPLALAAGSLLLGAVAHANSQQVMDDVPLTTTNWTDSLVIPQFDGSLGTLNSVFLHFEARIVGQIGVENLSPNVQDLEATLGANMTLLAPDMMTQLFVTNPSQNFDIPVLQPYDGTTEFGGTSGFTTPLLMDMDTGDLSIPPRGVLTLAQFMGNGTLTFPVAAQGNSFFTGNNGNEASSFQLQAAARLVVTYNYTPIAQPCEDNLRDVPGSLLLFPRFDNRSNTVTVVTVTNTNCDFSPVGLSLQAGTVDVEFVYIGRYGPNGQDLPCLETNRTRRLTPCDTITLLTRTDNPNMERGFLYVFAKSPTTGQAIVFNHLIGQSYYIGSSEFAGLPLRDALNARPFLGIGEQGSPTDLDGDGIRDLDGVEYSEAPDEILIPRFLGQDVDNLTASFESRLVLVGLSGGAQFTTQVFLLGYNDNEEVFSAQYQFRCWDDPKLADINGAFTESFLDSTNNAGNEILGASTKEAGWLRVDGQIAFSTAAAIDDPAVYAVLFERYGYYVVCDLPWELCTQDNGDLFPTGVFAD